MSEEQGKPFGVVGDEAVEARIVSWVLGEASEFEVEELRRLCGERPELDLFRLRIASLHGLAGESLEKPQADWKLPPDKRCKVLEAIGVGESQARRERSSRFAARRVLFATAACLVLTVVVAALMFPVFFGARAWKAGSAAARMAPGSMETYTLPDRPSRLARQEDLVADQATLVAGRGVVTSDSATRAPSDEPAPAVAPAAEPEPMFRKLRETAQSRGGGLVPEQKKFAEKTGKLRRLAIDLSELADSESGPVAGPAPVAKPAAAKPAAAPSSTSHPVTPATPAIVPAENAPANGVVGYSTGVIAGNAGDDPGGMGGGGGALGGGLASGGLKTDLSDELTRPNARSAGSGEVGYGSSYGDGGVVDGRMELGKLAEQRQDANGDIALNSYYAKPRFRAGLRAGTEAGEASDSAGKGQAPMLGDLPVTGRLFGTDRGEAAGTAVGWGDADEKDRTRAVKEPLERTVAEEEGRKSGEKGNKKGSEVVAATEQFRADLGAMEGDADVDADGVVSADPFAGAVAGAALKAPEATPKPKSASSAVAGQIDGGAGLGLDAAEGIEENRVWHGAWKREQAGPQSGEQLQHEESLDGSGPVMGRARGFDRLDSGVVELEELAKAVDEQPRSAAPRGEAKPAADVRAGIETATRSEARLNSESVVNQLSLSTRLAQPAGGEADFRWSMRAPEAPRSAVQELQERISGVEGFDGEAQAAAEPEFKTRSIEVGRDFIERLSQRDVTKESAEGADPFAEGSGGDLSLLRRQSAGEMLHHYGFALPEGASVDYDVELGTLVVKAPESTLTDLQGLIETLPAPPSADDAIDLMAEVSAADEPFSTFSLHVSDASFRVAAAALERGERPDPQAVRPEEFYNAFDYGDPAPTAGEPVACAIEQCAHPLLPSRNLVRVGVRTAAAGRGAGQALRLTVLLDNSGSMERADRRAAVQAAMTQLASLLGPQDVITVVGFARQPRLLADRVSGEAIQKQLEGLVERTPAEGGTNLEQALALADELAMRQFEKAAQNRIVLLTDGAANLGNADPEQLAARVEGLRQHGISFDAAGFGTAGLNDRMLERLTRDGDGRYYVVDGPEDADEQFARKLAGAFRPAAENVKVQVRFNPARVGSYRLIGFEEHRLKKEDFRDDTVDAAEMAAEEAGVAVYQVELLPEGEGEIGEVSVRFRDASKGRMVERSWTMPHDESAPAFDQAPASMQVAGLAVLAADALRDGPLAPLTDWGELAPVTSQVRAEFGGSESVGQLLQMVERLRE